MNRTTILSLGALVLSSALSLAADVFDGTYELSRSDPPSETILPLRYSIEIKSSKASVTYHQSGRDVTKDAELTKVIRTGIDPETKQPASDRIVELRVAFLDPGWNSDKFLTTIKMPFTIEGAEVEEKVIFESIAKVERTWIEKGTSGITMIGDPMGVRCEATYKLESKRKQ